MATTEPVFGVRNALSTLATWSVLIVGALYAGGRLLAEVFYRRFGLSASSVGLSSTDLVGQAAGTAIWLVVLVAPGLGLLAVTKVVVAGRVASWGLAIAALTALVLAVVGAPVAALVRLGDLGQVADYGVPVAAIGLFLLMPLLTRLARGNPRPFKQPAPSSHRHDPPLGAADEQEPRLVSYLLGSKRIGNRVVGNLTLIILVVYGLVTAAGLALSVYGVIDQAEAARDGAPQTPAPWSLAPSVQEVQVLGHDHDGLPEHCIILLARADGAWMLWDDRDERLWRVTDNRVDLVDC